MGISILTVAAIVVLALITLGRGQDRSAASNGQAKWLLRAALILSGLYAAFYLIFGIGEMISGEMSGVIHLASAVTLAALIYLAWRRPMEGGIVLVILGVLASLYYGVAMMQGGRAFQLSSLVGGAPYLMVGLLFIAAVMVARRKLA